MNMNTTERNGITVLALSGEVDLSQSPLLRKALTEMMLVRKPVVVDLSAVTYIDSSGIAGLVEAYQMARKSGGRFVLAAISDPVRRVLQLARLDKVFSICDSVDEALK